MYNNWLNFFYVEDIVFFGESLPERFSRCLSKVNTYVLDISFCPHFDAFTKSYPLFSMWSVQRQFHVYCSDENEARCILIWM